MRALSLQGRLGLATPNCAGTGLSESPPPLPRAPPPPLQLSSAALPLSGAMTSTYDCPNWHLSACGWWFKRLFNSRDETALHSELG